MYGNSRRRKEREKGKKSIFKAIMDETFPNLGWEMDIHIHEVQTSPNRLNSNRATLRHIAIKSSKVKNKERILRPAREKREVTYKGTLG